MSKERHGSKETHCRMLHICFVNDLFSGFCILAVIVSGEVKNESLRECVASYCFSIYCSLSRAWSNLNTS